MRNGDCVFYVSIVIPDEVNGTRETVPSSYLFTLFLSVFSSSVMLWSWLVFFVISGSPVQLRRIAPDFIDDLESRPMR